MEVISKLSVYIEHLSREDPPPILVNVCYHFEDPCPDASFAIGGVSLILNSHCFVKGSEACYITECIFISQPREAGHSLQESRHGTVCSQPK